MQTLTTFADDAVVVISPDYHIRPNVNRCIVYPYDPENYATWKYVSGLEGIALTLLDGQRTLRQATTDLAFLFDIPPSEAERTYHHLIERSCEEAGKEFLAIFDGGRFHHYPTNRFVSRMSVSREKQPLIQNKLDAPLSLLFMPSNACRVDCVYCYSERRPTAPEELLPVERWIELIDEAAEMDIALVTFSGGDPMTYPGIDQLFRRLSEHRIKFLFSTKSLLSKERIGQLAGTGMREFATAQVSIDGVTAETVDAMMRTQGYHERAFQSIENLAEASFYLRTNTVCTPINVQEAPELVRKLHALGVQRASFTNYGRSHYRHNDALFLNSDQVDWLNRQVQQLKEELAWEGLTCNAGLRDYSTIAPEEKSAAWQKRSDCSGGTSSLTITPNGDVVLCEQVPQMAPYVVGNVKRQSLREVWDSPQIEAFLYPPKERFVSTVCHDCEEFDDCHLRHGKCFRDALFTYGTPYAPAPNCPRAVGTLRMA